MNFDFSDEQKLLQQTARDYLEANSPLSTCREILEGDQSYAAELWKGAAEMGWQGAVIPEEYGGAGFGYLELAMIAHEVGRALSPIPFSSSVYLATATVSSAIVRGTVVTPGACGTPLISHCSKVALVPRLSTGVGAVRDTSVPPGSNAE